MKRFCIILLFTMLAAGCGPSPETIATETAMASTAIAANWTVTPTITSTPTSTPIPYDLTVLVEDEAGNPIEGAVITLLGAEGIENTIQLSDSMGRTDWTNLPKDMVTLTCFAQGYLLVEAVGILTRGENEIVLTTSRDPYSRIPGEVVDDGETLLFIEDFQDNAEEFIDLFGNWEVMEDPSQTGNKIIEVTPRTIDSQNAHLSFGPTDATDFIAEFRFKYINLDFTNPENWVALAFRTDYNLSIPPFYSTYQIIDLSQGEWTFPLHTPMNYKSDFWYTARVEAIGSTIMLYLNDNFMGRLKNVREPEAPGLFGFFVGTGATVQLDDILIKSPAE